MSFFLNQIDGLGIGIIGGFISGMMVDRLLKWWADRRQKPLRRDSLLAIKERLDRVSKSWASVRPQLKMYCLSADLLRVGKATQRVTAQMEGSSVDSQDKTESANVSSDTTGIQSIQVDLFDISKQFDELLRELDANWPLYPPPAFDARQKLREMIDTARHGFAALERLCHSLPARQAIHPSRSPFDAYIDQKTLGHCMQQLSTSMKLKTNDEITEWQFKLPDWEDQFSNTLEFARALYPDAYPGYDPKAVKSFKKWADTPQQ